MDINIKSTREGPPGHKLLTAGVVSLLFTAIAPEAGGSADSSHSINIC